MTVWIYSNGTCLSNDIDLKESGLENRRRRRRRRRERERNFCVILFLCIIFVKKIRKNHWKMACFKSTLLGILLFQWLTTSISGDNLGKWNFFLLTNQFFSSKFHSSNNKRILFSSSLIFYIYTIWYELKNAQWPLVIGQILPYLGHPIGKFLTDNITKSNAMIIGLNCTIFEEVFEKLKTTPSNHIRNSYGNFVWVWKKPFFQWLLLLFIWWWSKALESEMKMMKMWELLAAVLRYGHHSGWMVYSNILTPDLM